MADYTWPEDLVPFAMAFYLRPHSGGSESPFTREAKVYGLSAPQWVCRMQFRGGYSGSDGLEAYGPRLDAMIAKLRGRQKTVALWDVRRETFRNSSAAPGNEAALAGASTITLTGLDVGSTVYEGDYLGGDGRPHIILEDVVADVNGEAVVSFAPPLADDIATDAVVLGNPTGTFRLTSDDAGDNMVETGQAAVYGLEFTEDLMGPVELIYDGDPLTYTG